jgi:hypothetical protein
MDAVKRAQAILDEHQHDMPEGVYLKLCDAMKAVHTQAATPPQGHPSQPTVQDVAPWSVDEQPGQFTYTFCVPAQVRTTTDVDLRRVHDYGLGGWGHRYFWYRNSPDDQYHELPMHLERIDSEGHPGEPTDMYMYKAGASWEIQAELEYNVHHTSEDLRTE